MSRRAGGWSAIAAVVVVTIAALAIARPYLAVGIAYKAKMLCSEIFVAGRPQADVVNELAIDDLAALRVLHGEVNQTEKVVTSGLLMFGERSARYNGATGCTLDGRASTAITRSVAALDTIADSVVALPPDKRNALEAALDSAFAESAEQPRRTRAVVVMQNGRIVAERYARGFGAATPLQGWSMTKSVLNALVGIAIQRGALSLDDPVRLQAWHGATDARSRISVSHLLRMSSGLAFNENQASPSSDVLRMLFGAPDMAAFASSKTLSADPGTTWKYSTATTMILSRVLRESLGDDVYLRFPREVLFDPLGMTHAVIETDASGTFVASSYMYATAREWARFGQLFLQDGVWRGRRILPEGWVAYTRTPAPASGKVYGAHFWLETPSEYRGPPAALPSDAFHAVGHEGQFITIVPSRGVVIVRMGRTRHASAWHHDRFVASILAAL